MIKNFKNFKWQKKMTLLTISTAISSLLLAACSTNSNLVNKDQSDALLKAMQADQTAVKLKTELADFSKAPMEIISNKQEIARQSATFADAFNRFYGTQLTYTQVGGSTDFGQYLATKLSAGVKNVLLISAGSLSGFQTIQNDLLDTPASTMLKDDSTSTGEYVIGSKHFMPQTVESFGLIYNKDVFKNASITVHEGKSYNDVHNETNSTSSQPVASENDGTKTDENTVVSAKSVRVLLTDSNPPASTTPGTDSSSDEGSKTASAATDTNTSSASGSGSDAGSADETPPNTETPATANTETPANPANLTGDNESPASKSDYNGVVETNDKLSVYTSDLKKAGFEKINSFLKAKSIKPIYTTSKTASGNIWPITNHLLGSVIAAVTSKTQSDIDIQKPENIINTDVVEGMKDALSIYGHNESYNLNTNTVDKAMQSVAVDAFAMSQNGTWATPQILAAKADAKVGFLPMPVFDKSTNKAKFAKTVSQRWAMTTLGQNDARKKTAQLFLQFMYQTKTGSEYAINQMQIVSPFTKPSGADYVISDQLLNSANNYTKTTDIIAPIDNYFVGGFNNTDDVLVRQANNGFTGTASNIVTTLINEWKKLETASNKPN